MAEDFYNDSPEPAPSADPAVEKREEKAADANVAMLPKSFFPGGKELSPGNSCRVVIDEVFEDQVTVRYGHESESEEPEAAAPAVAQPIDEEMQAMMA